jgi:PadR family transcriptional regulator PadR
MAGRVDPKFEAELRRGVVQLVALHFLETPRYGYDLVRLLGAAGFAIEEGTLYPILRRFEKQGVLTSRWDTEGTRPRKYYELSEEGRLRKNDMLKAWGEARDATDEALRHATEARRPASTTDETPEESQP